MVSEIRWSIEAVVSYNSIIDYLLKEWTEKEVHKFGKKVADKINILASQPKIGKLLNRRHHIYRTIVHKKVSLVYRYTASKKEIELVIFWNHSQDPRQLRKLLN